MLNELGGCCVEEVEGAAFLSRSASSNGAPAPSHLPGLEVTCEIRRVSQDLSYPDAMAKGRADMYSSDNPLNTAAAEGGTIAIRESGVFAV